MNKDMQWYWILLIVVGAIGFLFLCTFPLLGAYAGHKMSHPNHWDIPSSRKVDVDKGLIHDDFPWKRKAITFLMSDGYIIHGDYAEKENAKGAVLFAHGYSWTREGMVKYGEMFYQLGYSCFFYDERGHGENKPALTTMGYLEGRDCAEVAKEVKAKLPKGMPLILDGESMGAASVLLALQHDAPVDAVIADCPYASLRRLIKDQLKQAHVASMYAPMVGLYDKIFLHYSPRDVEPILSAKKGVPILVIHGDSDTMIPYGHSVSLYQANPHTVRLFLAKGCDHAKSFETDPARYARWVKEFLDYSVLGQKDGGGEAPQKEKKI